MFRIDTVECKKENQHTFRDKVNEKIRNLEENFIEVVDVKIMEGKLWDYPKHHDSLLAIITYKVSKYKE